MAEEEEKTEEKKPRRKYLIPLFSLGMVSIIIIGFILSSTEGISTRFVLQLLGGIGILVGGVIKFKIFFIKQFNLKSIN